MNYPAKMYGPKPIIRFERQIINSRHWACRLYSQKHRRMMVGRGARPETAYKAYLRNLRWYDQNCPGQHFPIFRNGQHAN